MKAREAIGLDAIIVTPGVRSQWASKDDQARVMTPGEAAAAGADFIVCSRRITNYANPREAVEKIMKELDG